MSCQGAFDGRTINLMKAHRVFRPNDILAEARAGKLTRSALDRAIETAEEFGNEEVARQLRTCLPRPRATAKRN